MVKMTYGEQLKHPNWQKKRLEVLEHYNWSCAACDAKEKTLHVHHRHYVSGRKAWEYELSELESLCEDCHNIAHESKDLINKILSQIPSFMWHRMASMLAGYAEEYVDAEVYLETKLDFVHAGQVAWYFGSLGDGEAFHVRNLICAIPPDSLIRHLEKISNS